jgi:hypothetical protein
LTAVLAFVEGAALGDDTEELAKAAQNPIANMISLPFQNNFNFGVGPGNDMQYVLDIQPVIPIKVSSDWNLITRTIAPVIYQPEMTADAGSTFGLGDINTTLFLSPAKPGKFIWGVGPIMQFPTATDSVLGSGKWCAGPAVLGLVIEGHWVVGALANNIWSYTGQSDRQSVNQFLFQYFINYNLANGWYLVSSPIMTANWEAESGDKWTVPLGGGVGKIFKIGTQAFNAQLQAFDNVVTPNNGPDWQLRFQIQLLFPK